MFDEIYIMGYGKLGKYIADFFSKIENVKLLGYLDNFVDNDFVFKPEFVIDKSKTVIIASINYMYEMYIQLKKLGFANIITFADLTLIYPVFQSFNQAFDGLRNDYIDNSNKYENLYSRLSDKKSKDVLDNIIEFRKTYDIELYAQIADDINNQYFEEFMPTNIDVFVDAGAFDGDTIEQMYKHGIKPNKIYLFEPDSSSINKAKQKFAMQNNLKYYNCCVYSCSQKAKFLSNQGLASCMSCVGDIEVDCVAIDDIVDESNAYIKLDVEGAEIEAIKGARRLLQNGSPFAICVYHKPSDIWKIPELLNNLIKDKPFKWNFYLRHYTTSVFETVLYGVPNYD